MVSESGIRESFQKVKEDIQDIRKSIDLSKYPDKKEFYDFIKALDTRLKSIESSISKDKEFISAHGKEHEKQIDSVEKSVSALRSDLKKAEEKRQEIALQVKSYSKSIDRISGVESGLKETSSNTKSLSSEMQKTREKLLTLSKQLSSLEARVIEMPDYSPLKKRIDELEEKLSETRKIVRGADIAELKSELSEITRDFSKLGSRFVGWNDLAKSNKKTDADLQHSADRINNLILSMDSLKENFLSKKDSEKISEEIKAIRKSINDILKSEVDLGEYALKSEMRESLAEQKKDIGNREKEFERRVEENYNARIKTALGRLNDVSSSLEILSTRAERAISELSEKVANLEKSQAPEQKEFRKLREDVDYVKANLVSSKDVERAVSGLYSERKKEAPENSEGGSDTSFSTYVTAFVIIALLVLAGYYLYTQLQPVRLPSNVTNPPSVISPVANESSNATTNLSSNNTASLALRNNECILKFECTNDSAGVYNYNCYFDESTSLCRCYKGGSDKCDENKTAVLAAARGNTGAANESSRNYLLYLIAIVALIVFTIILFYLFRKGEEAALVEEAPEQPKEEPKAKKRKGAR